MNAKNALTENHDPITSAEALVGATAITMKEAEIKFLAALEWYKVTIKAHAEANITLMYVRIKSAEAKAVQS